MQANGLRILTCHPSFPSSQQSCRYGDNNEEEITIVIVRDNHSKYRLCRPTLQILHATLRNINICITVI